jgi:hypothetical protein
MISRLLGLVPLSLRVLRLNEAVAVTSEAGTAT